MATPNVDAIIAWVQREYPNLPRIQTTNCRPIAGSSTWSQHSWANAADIFVTKAQGDELKPRLQAEFGPVIKTLLWQVKDHFDHIHVDTWPTGILTPPCAGGTLRVRHKDGTVATSFTKTINEGDDDMRSLRLAVAEAQNKGWLNAEDANYWLLKASTPDDPEWQDFENAWAGWKLQEAEDIQAGLTQPKATTGGLTAAQVKSIIDQSVIVADIKPPA